MGDSSLSQSQAFAAALQRAKQIAAKIQPSGGGVVGGAPIGQKRPFDDESGPEAKKFSSPGNGNNGGGNMSNAVAQAAAVATRLAATGGSVVEEEIRFPEKILGLMVGRTGSDNLSHIEIESGAKIQVSKEANRCCVLRGSRECVTKAREMIQHLSTQNGGGMVEILVTISMPPPGPSGYPPYQEIMVPGPKVGLVIGKGGETIKMLQEKTGAKMVIIQDGPNQEVVEKPLRISGDHNKIEHAKTLVFELIRDKETNAVAINTNPLADTAEVFVPKIAVGVVIGKGGDMIKKIQGETGCKLQFIQGKNDEPGDRRCIINGNREQVENGKRMIEGLIESVLRSNEKNGRYNNNGNQQALADQSNYGYGYGVNHTQPAGREEVTFSVPASKCGIVIGRGGETIKLINQQSGAHCEMDRTANNPPTEKLFKAKGTAEQIEHARSLISEKINMDIVIASRKTINGGGGGSYDNSNYQQQWGNAGGYAQQGWEQPQQQQAANGAQSAGGQDYSQQWIEYYKSMGMMREAEAIELQMKQKQQQEQAAQNNGQTQDYSAQWAEYYRSIGKTAEAEAIEKQINKGGNPPQQPAAPTQQPQQQQPQAQPAAQPNTAAGYPPNMAAQYAQYSQYYAAAAGQAQGFPGQPQGGYPGAYGMYPQGQPQQPGGPPGSNGPQHKKQDKK